MCWNFDEEKMSRAAAFITDCSRDKRCDETSASVELPYLADSSYTRRVIAVFGSNFVAMHGNSGRSR